MKKLFYKLLSYIMGSNVKNTPVSVIRDQLREPRPLPTGMTEFEEWSDRIISGTMLTAEKDSLKFALASMLRSLPATEDHKEDIFFIKHLRRSAVEQIALAKMQALKEAAAAKFAIEKAKLEAEQIAKEAKAAEEGVRHAAVATLAAVEKEVAKV